MPSPNFTQGLIRASLAAAALVLTASCAATVSAPPQSAADLESRVRLAAAVASPTRTPAYVERDRYRHPVETLGFFGVSPNDTVVEIFPGGGWYTEILAPYVAGRGVLYAVASDRDLATVQRMRQNFPDRYGAVKTAIFPSEDPAKRVPDASADVVLTFRNVHNWMMANPPYADAAFRQMFAMLKPGGTLGVVDHRLPETADSARERSSGYLKVSTVRRLAEAAGFQFAGASEINANPADTTNWPEGVWTLPPTLRLKDKDRDRYLAVGESDRMTLKFVKPR